MKELSEVVLSLASMSEKYGNYYDLWNTGKPSLDITYIPDLPQKSGEMFPNG